MTQQHSVRPILKWVGGKRQLLPVIIPAIPDCGTYVEPFVGGGAVLFALQPHRAIINDANAELINVYTCIRDDPDTVVHLLQVHEHCHSTDHFHQVRAMDREPGYADLDPYIKAARTIYLNRTCYNGLYRVNAAGQFNAPCGKYQHPAIVQESIIRAVSRYLRDNDITLMHGDYAEALQNLPDDAFVYLDPPYMPVSATSNYTGYTKGGFDDEQQVHLKEACDRLAGQGIPFLESNSDCAAIRDLYAGYDIQSVMAKRSVNARGDRRGAVGEVLIHG